jgi:hypothetical protein
MNDIARSWMIAFLDEARTCEKGQCVHPPTWSVRNDVGTHSNVCDSCVAWYEATDSAEQLPRAALLREAWRESGRDCSYCEGPAS